MRCALFVVLVACTPNSAPQVAADADVPVVTKEIPIVGPVPTDFFPPDTFSSGEAFTTAWYGKHLKAMHEPSLWAATARGQTVYRFLWLRTFHEPIAVRIGFIGDHVHLVATRLTGKGGYDPGGIDVQRERDLAPRDLARLEAALDAAGFDTMKPEGPLGLDGAMWIVERAKNGTYRLVERWSPKEHDLFARACNVFLELAGRDLITGDVY